MPTFEKATFKARQFGEKWEQAPVVCVLENQGFVDSLFEEQCESLAGALSRAYFKEVRYNFNDIAQGHYVGPWKSNQVSADSMYITAMSVEDVERHLGFKPTIHQLYDMAQEMEDAYMDLFWDSMKDVAEKLGYI
jgi:hypothetical protein